MSEWGNDNKPSGRSGPVGYLDCIRTYLQHGAVGQGPEIVKNVGRFW